MPSLKGYLPALFLEHTLTFELMHRYNLRRFCLLIVVGASGKIQNLQSRRLSSGEPGILVGLSESCSRISQSGFFGQHHTWNTVEGHMFLCSDGQEQIHAGKLYFASSICKISVQSSPRLQKPTLVADWRKCIPSGSLRPYLLNRGRFVPLRVVCKAVKICTSSLERLCWGKNPCFLVKQSAT